MEKSKSDEKNVPMERPLFGKEYWLETASVLLLMFCGPLAWAISAILLLKFTFAKYIILAYFIWIFCDKDSCEQGGRRRLWFRRLKLFKYVKDYFPVRLVKTVDLSPKENYLFAVFPHGIISMSSFLVFASDAADFEGLFKGIKAHLCTLKINFRLPFIREIALACGMIASSKKSLNYVLGDSGKGNSAALIVGGAAESLYTTPGVYKICLKNRKGFCKIALQNGAFLVPVFSFGEIEILHQVRPEDHSWLNAWQLWFKKITGIAPVIFYGKGIFGNYIGLLPRRVPLTVVVGEPIPVKKTPNPKEEEVDELHKIFTQKIIQLFNEEKHKYLRNANTELVIA